MQIPYTLYCYLTRANIYHVFIFIIFFALFPFLIFRKNRDQKTKKQCLTISLISCAQNLLKMTQQCRALTKYMGLTINIATRWQT